jgi:hypothetical protein
MFHALTLNVEAWTEGGLRYFSISDENANDMRKFNKPLKIAGQSSCSPKNANR